MWNQQPYWQGDLEKVQYLDLLMPYLFWFTTLLPKSPFWGKMLALTPGGSASLPPHPSKKTNPPGCKAKHPSVLCCSSAFSRSVLSLFFHSACLRSHFSSISSEMLSYIKRSPCLRVGWREPVCICRNPSNKLRTPASPLLTLSVLQTTLCNYFCICSSYKLYKDVLLLTRRQWQQEEDVSSCSSIYGPWVWLYPS